MRPLAALPFLMLVAACGQKADLRPLEGASLPPVPYGAPSEHNSEELLKMAPQAAPERSVELRTRSEEREDDPFDLPPE